MADPTMPQRPPLAALRAIEQIRAYRTWTAVEVYLAIREALEQPRDQPEELRMHGSGAPPMQGR